MKTRSMLILLLLAFALVSVTPFAAQDDAFPVTIEHKFGSTTITAAPERVVSIGFSEQDPLLALGIKPVAVRYWYGDEPNAIFPWAIDEADGAEPEVLNMPYGTLNYEAILALAPDLISAVDSGITQEEYDTLSAIAPTIAQTADYVDFGMPWQETTRLIGKAVGKSAEAEAAISHVEDLFIAARDENPQFAGKSIVVGYGTETGYGFYSAEDGRGRFFTQLGFVVPEDLMEIAGDSFYADISSERIDLLDRDVIIFLGLQFLEGGREKIEADPLINQLTAFQEGRVLFIPPELDDAMQFSTVLSLEYLLEGLVPELQAVTGGETSVTCEAGFRLVTTVCVPENPQRVVTLADLDLDAVLALGVEPVGITNGRGQTEPPRYLADSLPEDVTVLGDFFTPNLETLLEVEPDVILVGGLADEAVLEQLNAIAPVVDTYTTGRDWQTHFRTVADALNKQGEADAFLTSYTNRVAELQTELGDSLDTEFIVARWSAEGPQVMAPVTFVSDVLFDLGMTSPTELPELEAGHPHTAPLSLETLGIIDVDWAFIGTLQSAGDAVEALSGVVENPLFQALEVVQNDHVVFIDGSLWTSSGGPLATMLVLDDVEAALSGAK